MRKKPWLCYLGIAFLLSAIPPVLRAGNPGAAQTSAKKKKNTPARSKRKPKTVVQKAPTADRIREIQSALKREGAYQGDPTGKWDASTIEAMKQYQDKNGLNSTGKIDALTLHKLGLGSETAGKGAPLPTASTVNPSSRSLQ